MTRVYNCIDSDGHILEPLELWAQYMDPQYRDDAPRLVRDSKGKERLLIGQKMLGSERGMAAWARSARATVRGGRRCLGIQGRSQRWLRSARPYPRHGFGRHRCRIPVSFIGLFAGAVEDPKHLGGDSAAPTTAGWPITASRIRTACSASP